jgi:hypothetical protein
MTNISLIKENFQFLIQEYQFYIDRERYSPEVMGNAVVVYKSANTAIQVVVDRSQALLKVGHSSWPERDWFEFSDVMHYFAPHIKPVYSFQNENPSERPDVEGQLKKLVVMLKQYCAPILNGDFSMYKEIREIETKRVSEMLEYFRTLSQKPPHSE